ncbi:DinB family protein [Chitinophaga polysaccharea]|uniref:DinB family protein n=1 Tax=Chitinophaga polysaccharea TaxID=1293035 RepID=UPI001159FDA7|nr:DinB family protein [Chitinophaga polysaccharea]
MTSVNSDELLQELRRKNVEIQYKAENRFGGQTDAVLQHMPGPGQWSAMQCLEHLNTYGRFYLPALDEAITRAERRNSRPAPRFHSSWIGAWFTRLMEPGADGQLRSRMKSPKGHLPSAQPEVTPVLHEFIRQQEQMEDLLLRAAKVNIQQIKVRTSLSRFIKLSAGDTFGFLTAHTRRHVLQAEKAISSRRQVENAI